MTKTGLVVRTDGLLNIGTLRTRTFAWDELDRFEAVRIGRQRTVYAVLLDGSKVPLKSVVTGAKMRWPGGSTRAIESTLNRLLDRNRAT